MNGQGLHQQRLLLLLLLARLLQMASAAGCGH
jgi:hypothetical protein